MELGMTKWICALVLGLMLNAVPVLSEEAYLASGTITQDGNTLELKSAVAVWDSKEKTLTIGLFPFAVDEQDVRIMVSDGAQALAALKPSPNPATWERTPLGALQLRYKKRPKKFQMKGLQSMSLRASWLGDGGKTFAVTRRTEGQLAKAFDEFGGSMSKTGGEFSALLAGSEQFIAAALDWNIRLECLIHVKN